MADNRWDILASLLQSELFVWLATGILNWWKLNRYRGLYRIHEHKVQLEILDAKGEWAIFRKQQTVEYLCDGITVFQDQAFGYGDIFADYKCSPGKAVDFYPEGYRQRILISLRETKNRGDVQEFRIERKIHNGFEVNTGNFLTPIDYPTQRMSISVIFPPERVPHRVALIEQNSRRTIKLEQDNVRTLPDGKTETSYVRRKPLLYESYILQWEW